MWLNLNILLYLFHFTTTILFLVTTTLIKKFLIYTLLYLECLYNMGKFMSYNFYVLSQFIEFYTYMKEPMSFIRYEYFIPGRSIVLNGPVTIYIIY